MSVSQESAKFTLKKISFLSSRDLKLLTSALSDPKSKLHLIFSRFHKKGDQQLLQNDIRRYLIQEKHSGAVTPSSSTPRTKTSISSCAVSVMRSMELSNDFSHAQFRMDRANLQSHCKSMDQPQLLQIPRNNFQELKEINVNVNLNSSAKCKRSVNIDRLINFSGFGLQLITAQEAVSLVFSKGMFKMSPAYFKCRFIKLCIDRLHTKNQPNLDSFVKELDLDGFIDAQQFGSCLRVLCRKMPKHRLQKVWEILKIGDQPALTYREVINYWQAHQDLDLLQLAQHTKSISIGYWQLFVEFRHCLL